MLLLHLMSDDIKKLHYTDKTGAAVDGEEKHCGAEGKCVCVGWLEQGIMGNKSFWDPCKAMHHISHHAKANRTC